MNVLTLMCFVASVLAVTLALPPPSRTFAQEYIVQQMQKISVTGKVWHVDVRTRFPSSMIVLRKKNIIHFVSIVEGSLRKDVESVTQVVHSVIIFLVMTNNI